MSFPFTLITDTYKVYKSQKVLKKDLTWRRVSILRLNFEIFLFLVSEKRAVPSIRTASIDCFHPLPLLLLTLVLSLLPLSLALSLSLFFLSFSVDSCCWWRFVARTLVLLSVRPLLAESLHRGHCRCCVRTWNKEKHKFYTLLPDLLL